MARPLEELACRKFRRIFRGIKEFILLEYLHSKKFKKISRSACNITYDRHCRNICIVRISAEQCSNLHDSAYLRNNLWRIYGRNTHHAGWNTTHDLRMMILPCRTPYSEESTVAGHMLKMRSPMPSFRSEKKAQSEVKMGGMWDWTTSCIMRTSA